MKETGRYPGQSGETYGGKIRRMTPVYDDMLVVETTDHISAFDVVLAEKIPLKGAILNLIAAKNMKATAHIVPNCLLSVPHPRVSIWEKAIPFKVEMVIRGYLVGSSWRLYKNGERTICGLTLPDGMKENQKFPKPIITPTTKAEHGHDENISKEEIIAQGLVSKEDYEQIERFTYSLFEYGTIMAARNGLILVDTKYEFGKTLEKNEKGKEDILLIDEIHTPDSSRYFYFEGYEERFIKGEPQRQLSKEFVREWLMECGFKGEPGQVPPKLSHEFIKSITERYKELYLQLGMDPCDLPDEDKEPDVYESVCFALHDFAE
jgi:phosphoribosylaminoimidazole-succinocarboxamide synthase